MKKSNIGLLTFPISEAGNIPLSQYIAILSPMSKDIYLITGNDGYTFFKGDNRIHTYGIKHEMGSNIFTRILRYIYTQLKISYRLAKISKKVDLLIFTIGGGGLILPILTAKLFRKPVILAFAGSDLQIINSVNDKLSKPLEILLKSTCVLSNKIILYSPTLIKYWDLEKYKNKIYIARHHVLDFDKFKIKSKFENRKIVIGYIGRLSKEKGTIEFIKAIPLILEKRPDLNFIIGGNGPLWKEIEDFTAKNNLNSKVKLVGWILHDKLPDYLNELKLLVIPSYTEGLPNAMLEAMACGTPVLATPVGAITDVIKDGKTGFIMENNSPECIARNINRVLNHSNLEQIAQNAHALVEREYTYEKAVERWREIIESI